jgi:hypothetical protein
MDDEPITLEQHEAHSEERAQKLGEKIDNLKEAKKMTEPVEVKNIFQPGMLPAVGGNGLGGDGMGGLLALALLGGGLNNRRGDGDCTVATTALSNAGFDGINHNINTLGLGITNQLTQGFTNQNSLDIMAKLGSIEGAIPLAEAQVQLALAGSTATITAGQAITNKGISDAIAASLASQNNINVNVLQQGAATREAVASYGVANLTATKDAQFATATAIANSTKEVLAALNDQNVANLQRQLTVAETALLERNAALRARETEINITNTNTATATATQAQFQQQQQFQILANLSANVANLANDVQVVRQGQTIFNSGTMAASGTQAAANTKVN